MERGFGVILLLRRVWDAMAAHQQPMRIDRIRRTSDERDQILAGLNCQLFGIGRQNGSDLIDLIRIRVFKYCDVELVAFFIRFKSVNSFAVGKPRWPDSAACVDAPPTGSEVCSRCPMPDCNTFSEAL